ncbi:MAG: hypothetical protein IIB65_07105 [Proteobacteria bacterium]|nr:hypothetical protein [Pseudomonadota bacterium]
MSSTLSDLLEQSFVPKVIPHSGADYQGSFRIAIRWLEQTVGHEPTLDDATPANITAMQHALADAGMGVSFLVWGESTLNPILFAQDRHATMLSIFRVISAHPEISRALFGTPDVSWASIYLMGLAGGTVWAVAAWRNLPVVGASMLGFLAVVTSYKVGSQNYMMTVMLLAAYSVASMSRVNRLTFRPLFGVLIYLLFLESFQLLYSFTRWLEPPWNAVREFIGLPAFVLALIAVTTGLLFMEAGRDDKTASPGPRPP